MLTFNELKPIISKCCFTEKSSDLLKKYHFSINFKKLEEDLKDANQDLHVLSFASEVESRHPELSDMQLLSEYAHKQSITSSLFLNPTVEFIQFILYSTKEGELWKGEKIESLIGEEDDIFENLNNVNNMDLLKYVLDNAPMYYCIVIKRFNQEKDRFDYNVFFRYNSSMFDYRSGRISE